MRTRRTQLGLTGAELAHRAGISASYVSLIENGAKVPEDDVAAALARALGDDEALYRAWARAARLGLHDLEQLNRLEVIARTPAYVDLVEGGHELPEMPALSSPPPSAGGGELHRRMRDVAARVSGDRGKRQPARGTDRAADEREGDGVSDDSIIRVPVLRDGADPGRVSPSPATVVDRLLVDRRLVEDRDPDHLFAYDVTPAMTHLRGLAAPGDRLVFRRGGRVEADRICAVRTDRGVVLSRVLVKDRALLLLPGEGESEFESIDLESREATPGAIAGTHVLMIRR